MFVWRASATKNGDEPGIFAADHKLDQFHHSSFYAGQPVHFAGELKVEADPQGGGRLVELSNKSGHYKPGERQTLAFLSFLHEQGIELDGVQFRWMAKGNPLPPVDARVLLDDLQKRPGAASVGMAFSKS